MTKYEWETELKKNIHALPVAEQEKALSYYNELFMDKAEAGKTETQIIAEFGNPCDVADQILAEYRYDMREAEPTEKPLSEEKERPAVVAAPPEQNVPQTASEQKPSVGESVGHAVDTVVGEVGNSIGTVAESVGDAVGTVARTFAVIVGYCVSGFLWILLTALLIAGAAMLVGGVGYAITAIVVYHANSAGLFFGIGIGFVALGIGAIVMLNSKLLCRNMRKLAKSLTGKENDAPVKSEEKQA